MEILYCSDPMNPKQVDVDYAFERETASEEGLPISIFSYEELVESDNPKKALKYVSSSDELRTAIYRGWMLKPELYKRFYNHLLQKGVRLINSSEEYTHCHYLPESYSIIQEKTPHSIWIDKCEKNAFAIEHIMGKIAVFGDAPIILKDYVKSQKHYWHEACYIPNASDAQHVERVVTKFLELQGGEPEGGLVFRRFVEFQPIGSHYIQKLDSTCKHELEETLGVELRVIYKH